MDEDFSETNDLAASNPAKLKEMQALFMKEAERYRVLPIDDRSIERFDPATAGRPDLMAGRKSLTRLRGHDGDGRERVHQREEPVASRSRPTWRSPPVARTASSSAQGGRFGGWSLYVKDGKPAYTYNFVGLQEYTVNACEPLAPGKATIKLDFAYDGNGRGKGGTSTLSVNGKQAAIRTRRAHQRERLLGRRRRRCGVDEGTNVSAAYKERENKFTGTIEKVLVEVR